MGVRGFNRLLEEKGILSASGLKTRDPCGCPSSSSPWKADGSGTNIDSSLRLQQIPHESQLLIDGNGLAFYLHSIAYTRYIRSLSTKITSPSPSSGNASNCCLRIDHLGPGEIATTLPHMLPMSLLHEVTTEFVDDIQAHASVKVFWDGKLRRFKSLTDEKRQQRQTDEESNLQQFCRHGILPQERHCCQLLNHFPFSIMFLTAVKDALARLPMVETVKCVEEADIDLAREAKGKTCAFVVGYDSDFYFYKDIQYIPFDNLQVSRYGIHAFCATRKKVARLLGINDGQMIELALLLGNDYIVPSMCLLPDEVDIRNKDTILQYLAANSDFQTTVRDTTDQQAVDYVRALYDSHSLDNFLLDESDESERESEPGVDLSGDLTMAAELVDQDISVENANETFDQAVASYLKRVSKSSRKMNFSIPLDVIAKAYLASNRQRCSKLDGSLSTHPSWEEVKTLWFIQSFILRKYRSSMAITAGDFPLGILPPPFHECFNQIAYLRELMRARPSDTVDSPMSQFELKRTTTEANTIGTTSTLPIDRFEAQIIQNIHENRVTVIHGETGCGKSSRVPIMLLNAPAPDGSLRKVRFFCSQPRRIAAKALVERLRKSEPGHKNKIALRMGQGWREYESMETQAIFVTTGYLVRLLANHPEKFKTCTHLVIDEVHERSVDTDILCLLCRRLLETNETIRLVLMSATLATSMYCEYFDVRDEPIHVGTRTFPIQEYFLEDFGKLNMSNADNNTIAEIQKDIQNGKCQIAPSIAQISKRVKLASSLTTLVGKKGSSVLIFVPGMGEIIAMTESIEKVKKPGVKFKCFPVHSEIPFEEQMDIFSEPEKDEVKVIIATNVAESSITLPSVDHVICLGFCRQIQYNNKSHRQILMPAWISHASSKQRAGRTGRVREGSVYRLYTREAFELYMDRFEPGEMQRIPLDSVILTLKQIMGQEVIPIFNECLEPPNLDTIDRSFQSLHRWNLITEPNDKSEITRLGTFASSLGIDLTLGSFIGLGIQFCVAAEAIQMAAIMSVQRTPFQISSPLWMNPSDFNEIASATFIARNKFDGGSYSEPFAIMNAISEYDNLTSANSRNYWCYKHRLAIRRFQQIISVSNSLRIRVAEFFGIDSSYLRVHEPPKSMQNLKLTILRVLKVWVFSESVIECKPSKNLRSENQDSVYLSVQGSNNERLTEEHLYQILDKNEPYCIKDFCDISQHGAFRENPDFPDFIFEFEKHLISYMSECGVDAAFCQYSDDRFSLIVDKESNSGNILSVINSFKDLVEVSERYAIYYSNIKRRGKGERKCGAWTVLESPNAKGNVSATKSYLFMSDKTNDYLDSLCHQISSNFSSWDFDASIRFKFFAASKKSQAFSVSLRGICKEITRVDMQDMIGREILTLSTSVLARKQSIVCSSAPSEQCPSTLIPRVSVNVRILSLLASAPRRDFMLRFPGKTRESADADEETTVDFKMSRSEVNVLRRWKKLGTKNNVFVDDSLPASAIHLDKSLYAVASNALDLSGGNVRVDGLTLLPSSPLFLVLSFLTFGLSVDSKLSVDADESEILKWMQKRDSAYNGDEEISIQERIELARSFNLSCIDLRETLLSFPDKVAEFCKVFDSIEGTKLSLWDSLIETSMTEDNLSKWQCEYKMTPKIQIENRFKKVEQKTTSKIKAQDDIQSEGSIETLNEKQEKAGVTNLLDEHRDTDKNCDIGRRQCDSKGRKPNKITRASNIGHVPDPVEISSVESGTVGKLPTTDVDVVRISKKDNKKLQLKISRLSTLPPDVESASKDWFDVSGMTSNLSCNVKSPSNVIALLHKMFGDQMGGNADSPMSQYHILLNKANWNVDRVTTSKDKTFCFYRARFVNFSVPPIRAKGRGKQTPAWIKKDLIFPNNIEDTLLCLPPDFEAPKRCLIVINCGHLSGLWFSSIQDAVQMESAIWLERRFCNNRRVARDKKSKSPCHWYEQTIEQMVDTLVFERNR